ncbi:MAG: hypothetical protein JST28_19495 [Acidobacteria bacterium]|nr:hypothetical protein [Acidobacteriota bacterium]
MKSPEKNLSTLDELVSKYRVGFRIQPGEAADGSAMIAQVTCHLQLSGQHDSQFQCGGTSCDACIRVLLGLLDVVGRLNTIECETPERAGGACETRAHYASVSGPGHEVTLGVEMILRSPKGAFTNGWAWIFMQRIRADLTNMGCRNLAHGESVDCKTSFPAARYGRNSYVEATSDAMERTSRLIA